MILFPYRTSTPHFYFPWSTLGLIAFQALLQVVFELHVDPQPFKLVYGDGLHPLQWLTSNFVHAGMAHLLGNMVFLWVFGQIVEGRLGWWRFLLVYLGVGVAECAVEQTMMLGTDAVDFRGEPLASYGSSSIMFGLLVMSLVWAPWEKVYVLWYWFFYYGSFEVTTFTWGVLFVAKEALFAWLAAGLGFPVSSALLHLLGAAVGLIPAVLLLKLGVVESDDRDLLTWWKRIWNPPDVRLSPRGRDGGGPEDGAEDRAEDGTEDEKPFFSETPLERRATALELIRAYIRDDDARMARTVYDETVRDLGPWALPESEMLWLIGNLRKRRAWAAVKPLMLDYIRYYPSSADVVKLLLAQLFIVVDKRPRKGVEMLAEIPRDALRPNHEALRELLLRRAEEMLERDVLELGLADEV